MFLELIVEGRFDTPAGTGSIGPDSEGDQESKKNPKTLLPTVAWFGLGFWFFGHRSAVVTMTQIRDISLPESIKIASDISSAIPGALLGKFLVGFCDAFFVEFATLQENAVALVEGLTFLEVIVTGLLLTEIF